MTFKSLMTKAAILSAAGALALTATSAQATSIIFNPGVYGAPTGYTLFADFNTVLTGQLGVTAASAGASWYFPTGSQSNAAALPGDTTPYLAVEGGSVNISFGLLTVKSFSLDFSTIDTYNTLTINYGNGSSSTITGGNILGTKYSTGQTSGSFIINGDGLAIASITLTTTSPAFEVDNLAVSTTLAPLPVPEPATWAMMLTGMGLIGFAARRRRNVGVSYA